MAIKNIIFDFEQVFIRWVPFMFFKDYVKTQDEMEKMLLEIDHHKVSVESDLGLQTFSEKMGEIAQKFPQYKDMLLKYDKHWIDTVIDVPETLEFAKDLKAKGFKLYGLSNFSADKIADVYAKFDFHKYLDGIIVSAFVKMIKPDLKIYQHICQKFDLVPAECVFFDDRKVNTDAAKSAGMQAFVFTTAQKARQDLETLIPLL